MLSVWCGLVGVSCIMSEWGDEMFTVTVTAAQADQARKGFMFVEAVTQPTAAWFDGAGDWFTYGPPVEPGAQITVRKPCETCEGVRRCEAQVVTGAGGAYSWNQCTRNSHGQQRHGRPVCGQHARSKSTQMYDPMPDERPLWRCPDCDNGTVPAFTATVTEVRPVKRCDLCGLMTKHHHELGRHLCPGNGGREVRLDDVTPGNWYALTIV